MDVPLQKRKILCVNYPGVIVDPQKALETIGGEANVSRVYSDPFKRLELKWRPQDLHCNATCGNRSNTTSLLLRVRRKKTPDLSNAGKMDADHADVPESKEPSILPDVVGSTATGTISNVSQVHSKAKKSQYSGEILGIIDSCYKFESLADFEYLPMTKIKDGQYESYMEDIYVKKLHTTAWIKRDVPLYLPPPIFSRIDNPSEYCFREGPKHREGYKDPTASRAPNLIGVARQRRPHYTLFVTYDDKKIPEAPVQEALDKLAQKVREKRHVEDIKKLFEERPIWTKNGLRYNSNIIHPDQYKYILPTLAYYFATGPWRSLWVKFGYDPRKDPSAKRYQLLDFRVRQRSAAHKLMIETKRSTFNYHLPNTVVNKGSANVALIKQSLLREQGKPKKGRLDQPEYRESVYIFRPGMIPPYRQMFYQLCDLAVAEIQELVTRNDGKETVCTEKDGWCLPETHDKIRTIITDYLAKCLKEPEENPIHSSLNLSRQTSSVHGKGGRWHKTKTKLTEKEGNSDVDKSTTAAGVSADVKETGGLSGTVDEGTHDQDSESSDSDEDTFTPMMDMERDSSDEGPEVDDDEEEDINEMETEMLEYMDPQY